MADFKRQQLEIQLDFVRGSYDKRNTFSKGFSKPKKDAQVIRVWEGGSPTSFFNSNYLFADTSEPHTITLFVNIVPLLDGFFHLVIISCHIP